MARINVMHQCELGLVFRKHLSAIEYRLAAEHYTWFYRLRAKRTNEAQDKRSKLAVIELFQYSIDPATPVAETLHCDRRMLGDKHDRSAFH